MARETVRALASLPPSSSVLGAQRLINPSPAWPHGRPRVTVLTPGASDLVTTGCPVLIRWQTSCLPGLLLYYIQLSLDGGATYRHDISPLLDGPDCRYLWIPGDDAVTSTARLRVVAINWGEATSEGTFIILPRHREASLSLSVL
ncbi:MAG: hypothetical protein AB7N91_32045 [Candidatus Tectimicrobiota bacterium]